MPNEPISTNGILRVEAQPASWRWLTEQQKIALEKLLGLLTTAVQKLPKVNSDDEPNEPVWLLNESHSQVSFVDGKRGSGKTTLMLSLTKALVSGRIEAGGSVTDPETFSRVTHLADCLKNRILVVEPIDMEPLPEDTPILAAIMARVKSAVETKCSKHGRNRRDVLGDDFDDDRETIQFQQMMSRVARSLDSNLQQRRGSLDRDQYGQNIQEQEEDRCLLKSDLTNVFRHLSVQLAQADGHRGNDHAPFLFLIPFDDVDLNPHRCLELFRIIRTYAPPQLFFLPMGQFDLVQRIFQIATAREFEKVASARERFLRFDAEDMGNRLAEIAFANVRKMIPEAMRIPLKPVSMKDVLKFRPLGIHNEAPTLGDLLGKIIFFSKPLDQVLSNKGSEQITDDFNLGDYPGLGAFSVAARRLVDLWGRLLDSKDNQSQLMTTLQDFLKGVIEEDHDLSETEKARIQSIGPDAVEIIPFDSRQLANYTSQVELDILPYYVERDEDENQGQNADEHKPAFQVYDQKTLGGGIPIFRMRPQSDTSSETEKSSKVIACVKTRCALVLLHDLLQNSSPQSRFQLDTTRIPVSLPPLSTKWSNSTNLNWHAPPLQTFYATARWCSEVKNGLYGLIKSKHMNKDRILRLFWSWTSLGKSILDWEENLRENTTEVKAIPTLELETGISNLHLLQNELFSLLPTNPLHQEWLKRTLMNGMPEILGFPLKLKDDLVEPAGSIKDLVKRNLFDLRVRRKAQLQQFSRDLGRLGQILNETVTKDSLLAIRTVDIAPMTDESIRAQMRTMDRKQEARLKELSDAMENRFRRSERRLKLDADLSLYRSLVGQAQSLTKNDTNLARSVLEQAEVVQKRIHQNRFLESSQQSDYIAIGFQAVIAHRSCDQNSPAVELRESLLESIRLMAAESERMQLVRDTFVRLILQGDNENSLGNRNSAKAIFQEALELMKSMLETNPESTDYQRNVAIALNRIGDIERENGNREAAKALYEQYLSMTRILAGKKPDNLGYKRDLGIALNRVGDIETEYGNRDPAKALYEESLSIRQSLSDLEPNNLGYRRDLAVSLNRLGDIEREFENVDSAKELYQKSLATRRSLVNEDNDNPRYQGDLCLALQRLGRLACEQRDYNSSRQMLEEMQRLAASLVQKDSSFENLQWLAESNLNLGLLELELGNAREAANRLRLAESIFRDLIRRDSILSETHLQLAETLWELNRAGQDDQYSIRLDEIKKIFSEQRSRNSYFYREVRSIESRVNSIPASPIEEQNSRRNESSNYGSDQEESY